VNFTEYDMDDGALAVVRSGRLGDGCGGEFVGRVEVMFNEQGQPTFAPPVQQVFIPVFEIATQPTAKPGVVDEDVLRDKGVEVVTQDIHRKARELESFGHGCNIVCLYRKRMITLRADTSTLIGVCVFSQLAMFGVSECLCVFDERKGLGRA
jgi:hypothetical protein